MPVKRFLKKTFQGKRSNTDQEQKSSSPKRLHALLEQNLREIGEQLGNSSDITIRRLRTGLFGEVDAALIYTDGLADNKSVNHLAEALMFQTREMKQFPEDFPENDVINLLMRYTLSSGNVKEVNDFESLFSAVLSGDTVVLLEGYVRGMIVGTKGWEDRGVSEPSSQSVVRGPREAFSESLRTNTALIRRRIKDPRLRLEQMTIGRVTKTEVALMYLKGIADEQVLAEARSRLSRIDIDGVLESGYIEEMIQDTAISPFPLIYNSERPDVVAANLLEGRVAILVDGTPFVLLIPALFVQFFQAAEDYYHRFDYGLIRILRLIALIIALLGPGFYISITTFHQEMIPTELLISLAAQREGIPFPAFIEALLMETTFEILREAGVRMPRTVGPAISIVGALVLGDAAVNAGLVSPAMVIVVSITAISSFVIPAFNMGISLRMIRFLFMIFAAIFGLMGMTIGIVAMVLHLCSLKSFGAPYMMPLAPFRMKDQKDVLIRAPMWRMFSRPSKISGSNVMRESTRMPTFSGPERKK